jgi:hypothetical protein
MNNTNIEQDRTWLEIEKEAEESIDKMTIDLGEAVKGAVKKVLDECIEISSEMNENINTIKQ